MANFIVWYLMLLIWCFLYILGLKLLELEIWYSFSAQQQTYYLWLQLNNDWMHTFSITGGFNDTDICSQVLLFLLRWPSSSWPFFKQQTLQQARSKMKVTKIIEIVGFSLWKLTQHLIMYGVPKVANYNTTIFESALTQSGGHYQSITQWYKAEIK